jgi:bifunctional non-homologous end joining protein LigD
MVVALKSGRSTKTRAKPRAASTPRTAKKASASKASASKPPAAKKAIASKESGAANKGPAAKKASASTGSSVAKTTRLVAGRTIELSSLDKVMFPDGTTKGDLVDYYDAVAPRMLPFLRGRPLVLERFPDGIGRGGFFQKEVGAHYPDWVERVRVAKEGGRQNLVVCNDRATLVYLANQRAVVFHPWLSCTTDVGTPDTFVLDLDPPSEDFELVRNAARSCRRLFDELGMPVFLKTSGSRGLHLVVPLAGGEDFDAVREVAARLADELVRRHPRELTTEQRKAKRAGRVYLDIGRNAYAQTAVAAYSVRAREGAPVSAPLDWTELDSRKLGPRSFTIRNVLDRSDPWTGWRRRKCSMKSVGKKLEGMREKTAVTAVGAKRRS